MDCYHECRPGDEIEALLRFYGWVHCVVLGVQVFVTQDESVRTLVVVKPLPNAMPEEDSFATKVGESFDSLVAGMRLNQYTCDKPELLRWLH